MIFVVGSSGSGGGGGPTAADAILTVTAPAGATVTATKGGTSLTPTLWTAAADATQECALFVISSAQFDATTPWTVTATSGTDTATDTVTIDSNKQYYLWLSFGHYLYRNGDEFTSRTGGWAWANAGTGTYVNNTTAGQMEVTTTGSNYQTFLHTVNTVSVSEWSAVKCLIQTNKSLNLVTSTSDERNATAVVSQSTGILNDFTEVTLDVSSQMGLYYIGFRVVGTSTVYAVKAVWCE